jgi:hypothetical protein
MESRLSWLCVDGSIRRPLTQIGWLATPGVPMLPFVAWCTRVRTATIRTTSSGPPQTSPAPPAATGSGPRASRAGSAEALACSGAGSPPYRSRRVSARTTPAGVGGERSRARCLRRITSVAEPPTTRRAWSWTPTRSPGPVPGWPTRCWRPTAAPTAWWCSGIPTRGVPLARAARPGDGRRRGGGHPRRRAGHHPLPRRPASPPHPAGGAAAGCRSASTTPSWCWSTTCCSRVGPSARRSTRWATSAGRAPSGWPCWWTAGTASCRSARTTSARTCPPGRTSG